MNAPRTAASRGSLLVVTLWMVSILSMLAVAVGRHLSTEIRLTKYQIARAQARVLARSGIFLAMRRLTEDGRAGAPTFEPVDWLGDDWAVPGGDGEEPEVWTVPLERAQDGDRRTIGRVQLRIVDEERKLDLNSVAPELLGRLLGNPDLAQAIAEYKNPADQAGTVGAGDTGGSLKHSAIIAIEELRDLQMMTPELFTELAPALSLVTTAFAQAATEAPEPFLLNLNTAGPEVLLAVTGETIGTQDARSVIDTLVAARSRADGRWGPTTEDDCVVMDIAQAAKTLADCAGTDEERFVTLISHLQSKLRPTGALSVRSLHFQIRAEAQLERPVIRYRVEAWVKRTPGPTPTAEILAWKEAG